MTLVMKCDDKDRLIAYLYGEDTPADRAAVEAHLARCATCAAEAAALRDVRNSLAEWQAPEVDLGFRVVRDPATTPAAGRRWWPLPAWAQAAAAVLVLAAGAGLANLDVQYGQDGLRLRTGWYSNDSNNSNDSNHSNLEAALSDLERRLRTEIARSAAAPAALPQETAAVPQATARGGDDVMRQVRALIEESERRQQRELALRLTDVVRDFDAQRRADLVRIEQNMGQIEGLTGAEAVRQRQLLDYLVRVSQQQR